MWNKVLYTDWHLKLAETILARDTQIHARWTYDDGVVLSGGGYRDPAEQIALRRQHCGSSYYAIYQMPSSSCRPPTARPGSSQHEVGLAIDFSPCSRGSVMYNWLKANAAQYGFYNLPSESWHWSTTGS